MNINCLCLYLLCFNCSKVEYMWLHAGDDSNYNYLNKSLALEGGDNRDALMIIPSILWSDGLTSGRFDDCHSKSFPFNNPINLTTFCFCFKLGLHRHNSNVTSRRRACLEDKYKKNSS